MEPSYFDPWMRMEADALYDIQVPLPYGSMTHSMNYFVPPQLQPPITINSSTIYKSCTSPNQAPVSALPSSPAWASRSRKRPTGKSTPRMLLTDKYRKMICLYHERDKAAKHTEIGTLFGLERSTVTKILRRKGIYLAINNRGQSPENRTKRRIPDIKTALSNLVKEFQTSKTPINDEILMKKALAFSDACSLTEGREALGKDWLEKFKRENMMLFAHNQPCTEDGQAKRIHQQCIHANMINRGLNHVAPTSVREPPSSDQARHAMELATAYLDSIGRLYFEDRVSIDRIMKRLRNDHENALREEQLVFHPSDEPLFILHVALPTNLFERIIFLWGDIEIGWRFRGLLVERMGVCFGIAMSSFSPLGISPLGRYVRAPYSQVGHLWESG
ncbi:uncharacterized protein N7511_011259 [Penicillium nucicola]|uniref:uncharacterized protein n=1 Tax=Penicillium nucicola TaxID=1850975 RepID=UPI002544E9D8|nr:uncharacterized protein N7511_011259 [Penicillium nucicola]KAJ5742527.1 hypothetical protein N7511_011259 [Penicillium nucicola]